MDLHENEKENRVTALFELPGLTPDQVNIEVHNGRLTVSGEVKKVENLDEGGFAFKERRCGKFSRTIQLPQGVEVCCLSFFFVVVEILKMFTGE
jgi:HSP20 family protein